MLQNTYTYIISVFFILTINTTFSQSIEIGTAQTVTTGNTASPVNIWYRRAVMQMVYTRAELNAQGIFGAKTLNKLGFNVVTETLSDIPGYTIKIKHTTSTNVRNSLGTTGWTTVKGPFTYSPTAGGFDLHDLTTSFNWNGIDNIGIEICWSQVQPNYDASGQIFVFTSSNGFRYRWDDNTGTLCGSAPNSRVNTKPHVRMIFDTFTTWTGSTSTNWHTASNWTSGVPNKDMDALISNLATNMPVISAPAIVNNLTDQPGTSIETNGSNTLTLHGNWNNSGTYIPNTGKIICTGISSTSLLAAGVTQSFYDLEIDNPNTVTLNGPLNLTGTLEIKSGNLNTNNNLTLISDINGTARVAPINTKCKFYLDMTDSYGDGWNGGSVDVLENGVSIGQFKASGFGSTDTFYISKDANYSLIYSSGSWENENRYEFYDPNNNLLFTDGPTPNVGIVYTGTANCTFSNPISGDITVERYIKAGNTSWRFLSPPIKNASLQDINDDFVTTGFTGSDYPDWPSATNKWVNIYYYDETELGHQDSGYVAATNTSNLLPSGEGIWAWSGDSLNNTSEFTIDYTGEIHTGDVSPAITYSNSENVNYDGWNLVGNPYPSQIDWNSLFLQKSNLGNAIYVWNVSNNQMASYNGGIAINGGSNIIAAGQAFWVKAIGSSPSITFKESCKTTDAASFLKTGTTYATIKVTNSFGDDETAIQLHEDATAAFDNVYDAYKLTSSDPNVPLIATLSSDSAELGINRLPSQEIIIPLIIRTANAGIHNITIDNGEHFSEMACAYILDTETGTTYPLASTTQIVAFLTPQTPDTKFEIHLGSKTTYSTYTPSCHKTNDGKIILSKLGGTNTTTLFHNQTDTLLHTTSFSGTDSISQLAAGDYYLFSESTFCQNSQVDTLTIIPATPVIAHFTIPKDTFEINEIIQFDNNSINAENYSWNFGDSSPLDTNKHTSHAYLSPNDYDVYLIASNSPTCDSISSKKIHIKLPETNSIATIKEESFEVFTNDHSIQLIIPDRINTVSLKVFDIQGKEIFSKHTSNLKRIKLNTLDWKKGMYLLHLYDDTMPLHNCKISVK